MTTYKVILNDGWDGEPFDAVDLSAAMDYAVELMLDDGCEPGSEACVYAAPEDPRGEYELAAIVALPECDAD